MTDTGEETAITLPLDVVEALIRIAHGESTPGVEKAPLALAEREVAQVRSMKGD